jgi:hypothetical protein
MTVGYILLRACVLFLLLIIFVPNVIGAVPVWFACLAIALAWLIQATTPRTQ